MIEKKAYAKINTRLNIIGRRPDGYHDLRTVMRRVSLHDDISLEISGGAGIKIKCSDASLANEHNIAHRAADLFFKAARVCACVTINIEKNIPIQAGLGGGSSDAAAVLLALNEYFREILPGPALLELAAKIGADVPFFVSGASSALCEGIGERITPLECGTGGHVLIAKPDYGISTKQAFEDWGRLNLTHDYENDFSALAFRQHPPLREICELMRAHGARQAELTGSGSALFGIFDRPDKARECELVLSGRGDVSFCGVYEFI